MPSFRLSSFMTLRDVQKIHQIGSWLLEHSDPNGQRHFLQSYSQFRAENMMKPLQFIADQIGPNNRVKSGQFVKTHKQEDQISGHIISGENWRKVLRGSSTNKPTEHQIMIKKECFQNLLVRKGKTDKEIWKRKINNLEDNKVANVKDKELDEQIDRIGIRQFTPIAFRLFAMKKAATRIAESNDQLHRDNAIAVTLFMLSSTVVLIQLETEQSSVVFANVSVEAEVLRQIVGACLGRVLLHALRVVDSYDGSFMVLLPLARFMLKHANQLASLSENLGESAQFASLQSSLYRKSILLIKDYRQRLSDDQIGGRFLPEDGNVHPINSGTLNLLKVLVQQQKLLNQLIQRAEVHESPGALAVQILKALSQNLRQKSSAYDDPALASLFMLNNLQYIGQTISRERSLLALLQGDQTALPASFEADAESYLQQFLKGWARIGEIFSADFGQGEEKRSVKSIFTVFTRDFDAIVEQQKIYCVADQITAANVRARIKSLVLQPFVEFSKKNSQECSELFEADRQLKYDAETIEMIIDRLFDATL
uniref:Exocyst complex component 7 n=1 Tax=Meloidogyne hapla TaxID=6305 RepID=A0A1I8B1W5_MELHA